MADSDLEKSEPASPKKRQEAMDEGQIPRSQELGVAASLLGGALILNLGGPALGGMLRETMGNGLWIAGASAAVADADAASATVQQVGWKALAALAMVLVAFAIVSLAVNAMQARGVFSLKPITPDFNRLNPLQGIKRVLGVQSVAELVKSLVKLVIVGWAVRKALGSAWTDVLALPQQAPVALIQVVVRYSVDLLETAGFAYLALAAADYGWATWRHEKQLMMTKEEVKQESKQSEGDPMVKHRQRSLARQRLRKRMLADVRNADVVVVNPVHIAVALRYDALVAPAPVVLAIGQRLVAQKIKELAYEAGIPVIENKPLARALLAAKVEPGAMIPAELYVAVAEVMAFVFRRRTTARGWAGSAVA